VSAATGAIVTEATRETTGRQAGEEEETISRYNGQKHTIHDTQYTKHKNPCTITLTRTQHTVTGKPAGWGRTQAAHGSSPATLTYSRANVAGNTDSTQRGRETDRREEKRRREPETRKETKMRRREDTEDQSESETDPILPHRGLRHSHTKQILIQERENKWRNW